MEKQELVQKAWDKFLCENKETIGNMQKQAALVHTSVNQKYDELPYSFHTNMVSNTFMQFAAECFINIAEYENAIESDGLAAIFGSIFHDTIEDCRLTYNDVVKIAKEYMGQAQAELAADIVYALTNEKGKTRAERANEKYYRGIRETPYAPCIKLCDRYANAMYANARRTSMAAKYSQEMPDFIEHIKPEDENDTRSQYFLPANLYRICMSYPLYKGDNQRLGDLEVLADLKAKMEEN